MTLTNHLQIGKAYCFWLDKLVEVPGPHIAEVCVNGCPYLAGSVQGEGIECLWDDGSDVAIYDAYLPDILAEIGHDMHLRAERAGQTLKGGAGSGNFGHGGRPGSVGGSATKQGHISRVSAMEKLGVKHASRMNAYFKYGMPSVKEGHTRHVKWPEAQVWFDTYTAAGKGKAGVKAANAALAVKKPPPEPSKAPPTPPQTQVVSSGSGLVNINKAGSGKVQGEIRHLSPTKEKAVRKQLSVLPQAHLDTIATITELHRVDVGKILGESVGPGFSVAGIQQSKGGVSGYVVLTRDGWNKRVLTHEVAHSVHFAIQGKSYAKYNDAFGSRMARFKIDRKNTTFFNEVTGGTRKAISKYAKTNALEFFAESYENYVHSPGKLKKRDSEVYAYMRDEIFGGVEYGK